MSKYYFLSKNPQPQNENHKQTDGVGKNNGESRGGVMKQEIRLKNNGDNTVTDSKTGLQWVKDHAAVPGFAKELKWKDAVKACQELDFAGHKDWRLPTREELLSIVDLTRYSPAIDPIFTNTHRSWYWASTPCAFSEGAAWCVDFTSGGVFDVSKGDYNYVRPVRSSQ